VKPQLEGEQPIGPPSISSTGRRVSTRFALRSSRRNAPLSVEPEQPGLMISLDGATSPADRR
jgi:hypothetical protein